MINCVKYINYIIEQIYPTACGLCGEISSDVICNKCKSKIDRKIISKTQYKYMSGEFVKCMYLCKYESELRNIMLSYKFKEKIYLYEFFVKTILKSKKAYEFLKNYDIIIPVPLHIKKVRYRGYNQCELISNRIAHSIEKMQSRNDILIKVKNNLRQSSLDLQARKENVKGAYEINDLEEIRTSIKGKNVLIFDDISTTMNTLIECVKILKKLNPSTIGAFTIFRD